MEEAITFTNGKGQKLFGIVHVPDRLPSYGRRVGVNLLNPGLKYRVAPHRLSVKLARRVCRMGYFVLRFDPACIGDSEGELPEGMPIPDIWGQIQTGLFVPDALAGNDFLVDRYGVEDLVMMGNCGGAITSLLAAGRDPRVQSLVLVDIPVYLWHAGKSFGDAAAVGGAKADWLFAEYGRRLLSPSSWLRLITLQTDFRALRRVLALKLTGLIQGGQKAGRAASVEVLCREHGLNPRFFESFETVRGRRVRILFVLAGKDPGFETFTNHFQHAYLGEDASFGGGDGTVQISVVEGANHVYTLAEWQEALMDRVCGWLEWAGRATAASQAPPRGNR